MIQYQILNNSIYIKKLNVNIDEYVKAFFVRDSIGALILLPRGRNRSLQGKSYGEKLLAYQTENILAQTLATGLYTCNPQLARFVRESDLPLGPIDAFNVTAIKNRTQLYTSIAKCIWGRDAFNAIASGDQAQS